MKATLPALLLTALSVGAFAAEIASVNFNAIKADLREYYLSKPENAEMKAAYAKAVEDGKQFHESIQKKVLEGGQPFDLKSAKEIKTGVGRFEVERTMDGDLRKELYLIVSRLGLKYELVFDSSDTNAIFFAKSQIDDLTPTVKQEIVKLMTKK